MRDNKFLKRFKKYEKDKTDKKIKKTAFDGIYGAYKKELIIDESYFESKKNINEERNRLNANIREKESSMNIINGLMIPVAILIFTALLTLDNTHFGITFFCWAMLVELCILTFLEWTVSDKINTYSICLDCINKLEKELEEEEKRRIEEKKVRIESQNKKVDNEVLKELVIPIVSTVISGVIGSGIIGKFLKKK